jgi:hypothetical protein
MIFPPIYEFGNVMVFEPGVPNKERIVLRPTEVVDLSRYGVWAAWQSENGSITPLRNLSFWFGANTTVTPPCWIVVFTGKGEFRQAQHPGTKEPVYCFHWGNEETLFNFRQQVPVLYRFDSFSTGVHMTPLPVFFPSQKPSQISQ